VLGTSPRVSEILVILPQKEYDVTVSWTFVGVVMSLDEWHGEL
jgi:hypothetical protein